MTDYTGPRHFAIKGGCTKKPTRLHTVYQHCLDVTTWLVVAFVGWCWLVIVLGVLG